MNFRLRDFIKLHKGGIGTLNVTIYQYDKTHGHSKIYFKEADQEQIEQSEIYKEIENRRVEHFSMAVGRMCPVEVCIYLYEEETA